MKLVGSNEIDWIPSTSVPGFTPSSVVFGQGNAAQAMQIATGSASSTPTRSQLKSLYAERKGKLPISLMIAVEHDEQVSIFGPDPDSETLTLRAGNAMNFLNAVLSEPEESLSYQKAISIRRSLQTTNILGFTNNGLFASHYIRTSGPSHPSWNKCLEESKNLVDLRNKQLIEGLGFEITSSPANTHVLRAKGQDKRVVAVLLDQNESFDGKSPRFQSSPVEWGLNMASNEGAPWLIAIRDSQIRLYPAKDGVGVGQKSQVETYFEIDLITIDEEKSAFLPLVFSAEALSEGGTADELLRESKKFAAALGTRLRERVYESIVPQLSTEIANQLRDKGHKLDTDGLQLAYGLTLRVLFRLLFQAYAEDRGLLPAGRNERFDKNSLKDRAADLIKHGPDFEFGDASSIWLDCMQIWNAIDQGSPEMQIPAYNGGLFGTDETLHPEGFLIGSLRVPDRVMGPALRALVIDDTTEDGVPGMVDFRSLSVREFGTIYEGLLESSLSVAEQDLTVDEKGAWVPAAKGETVLAKAGEVYFHSASGERKATGSYYTPSFVVDHLIERSVEPALKNHLVKVKDKIVAGDQAAAYDLFFDFRVADLAMGSGHFLVAAIDKIETVMRAFLLEPGNSIEGVESELKRLEEAAKNALGVDEAAYAEIERASLLRRQIARRCIYGLDINPLAVELSRLAIWIHTFVPGLPMSSLDHGLVCGNSLTGIGSIDEAMAAILPHRQGAREGTLLADPLEFVIEDALTEAKYLLLNSANADEATKREVAESRVASELARRAIEKVRHLFDVALGNRSAVISAGGAVTESELLKFSEDPVLNEFVLSVSPAHLPLCFPEVFIRENPGFDVLLGNPPWEKVKVEEQVWWGVHIPGFRGLPQREKLTVLEKFKKSRPDLEAQFDTALIGANRFRSILLSNAYPGLSQGGDPNLYQAFAWRNWSALRTGGFVSLVLPRGAMTSPGLLGWRKAVLESGSFTALDFAINNKKWMFGIHGQTEIVLASIAKDGAGTVSYSCRSKDLESFAKNRKSQKVVTAFALAELNDDLVIPVFPSELASQIFEKYYRYPKVAQLGPRLRFKPTREMDGTKQKPLFVFSEQQPPDSYPVWSGAAFNIWETSFGEPYAWMPKQVADDFLRERFTRAVKSPDSFHFNKSLSELPISKSRIVFRDTTAGTNRRTVICTLAPPGKALIHRAPYLAFSSGGPTEEAFVLGVMSSIPFDWLARIWVEGSFSFEILNRMPFPENAFGTELGDKIVEISANLANKAGDNEGWFQSIGAPRLDADQLNSKLFELDALVAMAYGLSMEDLREIMETFHPGVDMSDRIAVAEDIYERELRIG